MNAFLVKFPPADDVIRFEQNEFKSMAVTCTWLRSTYYFEVHDPDRECGWTHPEWDQDAMIGHAQEHTA